MPHFKDRLTQHIDTIEEIAYAQGDGASEQDLARLAEAYRAECGVDLPEDYADLLRRADGVSFNGLTIYATHDHETATGKPRPGFPESNERLLRGDAVIDAPLRFVGQTGDDLLAYDTARQVWLVVDRVSLDPVKSEGEHASAGELLEHMLAKYIGMWN